MALLASAGLLSGCLSPGPLPDRHQPLPADWQNRGELVREPVVELASWWQVFDDPVLDRLVSRTLAQNLTLAQASQRLRATRALIRPALAQGRPQLNASGGIQHQRRLSGAQGSEAISGGTGPDPSVPGLPPSQEQRTIGYYQTGFDAAWEIDLFGRAAAAADSARASAGIAAAEARMVRVSVLAELVRCYIELRGAQQRRLLLAGALNDQEQRHALMLLRRQAGIASDAEPDRARAMAAEIAAQLPLLDQAVQQAAQRLAILGGELAIDPGLLVTAGQPNARQIALPVIPADLLRTRPDIQRAESTVAQAAAELDISVAELYPRLSLSGDILASGNLVGRPLPGPSRYATAGLSFTLPLLDWGARRAVTGAREAELAAAILGYRQTVLEGVEETENALGNLAAEQQRAADVQVQVDAAQRADRHAVLLHQRGISSLIERLDAALARRQAELTAVDSTERQGLAIVALYKAVGGGAVEAFRSGMTRTAPVR